MLIRRTLHLRKCHVKGLQGVSQSNIEMSLFLFLGFAVWLFVEFARSEALRSPKGGAFRQTQRVDGRSPTRADFLTTPLFCRRIPLQERLGATISNSVDS